LGQAALRVPEALPEDACFHAQQCAEKALKALLVHEKKPFPRTHVLEYLLDLLKEAGVAVPPEIDGAFQLTQYAVETRYPGEWQPVSPEEAQTALATAERVLRWVEREIQER
jgi:HEPN domain-containing protein